MKSQIVISSGKNHGGRRKAPYVFTEQGIAMLSTVLKSKEAIVVNIQIMRTFVQLRSLVSSYADLEKKILALEDKTDKDYKNLLSVLLSLKKQIEPSLERKRKK